MLVILINVTASESTLAV